jgi:drug/metabolite transporter (DMT)-like permease
MVLMWSQSLISLPIVLLLSVTLSVSTSWAWLLILFGVIGYAGDVWFFHVLGNVDVSISNVAWSLLSLFLAAAGFFFFGDSWGITQSLGSVLIVVGALSLSLRHQRVDLLKMLWLVSVLALLYLPYYIVKKYVIDQGVSPLIVFFWMVYGREVFSFCFGGLFPTIRRTAIATIRTSWHFMTLNTSIILSFLFAEYMGALAYDEGPFSLVSIVGNIQPFIVMGIAGIVVHFWPTEAPKELLTRQSVRLKVLCFFIVFCGLALLSHSA